MTLIHKMPDTYGHAVMAGQIAGRKLIYLTH